jgi:hypothetical protein
MKPYFHPRKEPEAGMHWLNRTVPGIGLASLFSDWSHEIATTLTPAFLASMGVAAARKDHSVLIDSLLIGR